MSFLADRMARVRESPTLGMSKRAGALKAAGRDIITLSHGEPDFDTPENVAAAGIQAIRDRRTRYTAVDGMPELKAAVARKFARENGLTYAPDQIVVGSGAKLILYNAMVATINPGDEVIVPAPYWVSYPDMVALADGVTVPLPCGETTGFRMGPDQLAAAITPRTRMLIVNSPSNPTGAAYSAADLEAIAEVLVAHPEMLIMTDEIYEHLVYDGFECASLAAVEPRLYDRTITVNGASKGYAMTGWRIGFAGGPREIMAAIGAIQSQNASSPSTISQIAAIEALDGPQDHIARHNVSFKARRDVAVDMLDRAAGLACHRPEGAFYVYPNCAGCIGKRTPAGETIATDEDFVGALLDAEGVAAVHGAAFGLSPYFRISYALDPSELEEALTRIQRFCASLA